MIEIDDRREEDILDDIAELEDYLGVTEEQDEKVYPQIAELQKSLRRIRRGDK